MGWSNFSKTAEKNFLQPMRSGCKAEICTPVSQQYMDPRVCRKWGIPLSLVEARTEIWKFYFGRMERSQN